MSDEIKPAPDGGCSYDDCPQYDGKRCRATGCRPGPGCEPGYASLRSRADAAESERDALRDQIEHEGCATSHLGERTYSCRAESLCGLCRLRLERDAARAEVARLREALTAIRDGGPSMGEARPVASRALPPGETP